tara:strand:- start:3209 stop:3535 length:327 start_codon:yes stop_codon:yes gene_type:complete
MDHEAIYKAHPNVVTISDETGAFDINGNKVSLNQSSIDAARVELNKLKYKADRTRPAVLGISSTYPDITEQLDQLWHDIDDGKFGNTAKTGSWFVGISSVKNAYPKPS